MSQPAVILARKLYVLSLKDGRIDDERVKAVLESLRQNPPTNYKQVLERYFLKIQAELRKENARVDYAGSLSTEAIEKMRNDLCRYYNRDIKITTNANPELLGGIKIRIGDDVWETTIAGYLEKLAAIF